MSNKAKTYKTKINSTKMYKPKKNKTKVNKVEINKTYPVRTLLTGLGLFLIISVIFGFISLKTNMAIPLLLGVPIGTLLLFYIFGELTKGSIVLAVVCSLMVGLIGTLAGSAAGSMLSLYLASQIPSLSHWAQIQLIPNLVTLIIANALFAATMAGVFYGRNAIGLFAKVAAIVGILFGLLLCIPDISWIPFDQKILFIVTSYGTSTGLAVGLYKLQSVKNMKSVKR